jgi:DNA-binding MarR family transcriptional regulator
MSVVGSFQQFSVVSGVLEVHNALTREAMSVMGLALPGCLMVLDAVAPSGVPLKRISQQMSLDPQTVNALADELEHAELLYRARSPFDRRAFSLFGTQRGLLASEAISEAFELRLKVMLSDDSGVALEALERFCPRAFARGPDGENGFVDFLHAIVFLQAQIKGAAAACGLLPLQAEMLLSLLAAQRERTLSEAIANLGVPRTAALPILSLLLEAEQVTMDEQSQGRDPLLSITGAGLESARSLSAALESRLGSRSDDLLENYAALAEVFDLMRGRHKASQ